MSIEYQEHLKSVAGLPRDHITSSIPLPPAPFCRDAHPCEVANELGVMMLFGDQLMSEWVGFLKEAEEAGLKNKTCWCGETSLAFQEGDICGIDDCTLCHKPGYY